MLTRRLLRYGALETCCKQFVRPVVTTSVQFSHGRPPQENLLKRIARKFGWSEKSKSVLMYAGNQLFIKVADEIEYHKFFDVCDLEDTYASWFVVMELHLWMLSARLMEEGDHGKTVRNSMIQAMWEDSDVRSKKLVGAVSSARKEQIQILNETFQAAIIGYDEGLLGNDKILAGALWRRFLKAKEPQSQEELLRQIVALEMLVLYVRYQIKLLNSLSHEKLVQKRQFQFLPFDKTLFELAEKAQTFQN